MTSKFEHLFNSFELPPESKIRVVAILEDIDGSRYFIKTETGKYLYLDQSLEHHEEVDEGTVASAIIKHGYKPVADGTLFAYQDRFEALKKNLKPENQ